MQTEEIAISGGEYARAGQWAYAGHSSPVPLGLWRRAGGRSKCAPASAEGTRAVSRGDDSHGARRSERVYRAVAQASVSRLHAPAGGSTSASAMEVGTWLHSSEQLRTRGNCVVNKMTLPRCRVLFRARGTRWMLLAVMRRCVCSCARAELLVMTPAPPGISAIMIDLSPSEAGQLTRRDDSDSGVSWLEMA